MSKKHFFADEARTSPQFNPNVALSGLLSGGPPN